MIWSSKIQLISLTFVLSSIETKYSLDLIRSSFEIKYKVKSYKSVRNWYDHNKSFDGHLQGSHKMRKSELYSRAFSRFSLPNFFNKFCWCGTILCYANTHIQMLYNSISSGMLYLKVSYEAYKDIKYKFNKVLHFVCVLHNTLWYI